MTHIIYSYSNIVCICYLLVFWFIFLIVLLLILNEVSKYCGEYINMDYILLIKPFPSTASKNEKCISSLSS